MLGPDRILLGDTENGLIIVDASILFAIEGDLNIDGFVGVDDLNVILNNWNQGVPPSASSLPNVPEPGTAVVFVLSTAAFLRRPVPIVYRSD